MAIAGDSAGGGLALAALLALNAAGVRSSANLYAGSEVNNLPASPLLGDLTGLPSILLQVGSREIRLADSTRFAQRAQEAGVDVRLEIEEGVIHVWQMFPALPESEQALSRIGRFIREHF